MKHRSAHYWNWFIFFGLIAGLIYLVQHNYKSIDPESTWLLVTGVLGVIISAKWLNNGQFARPYDLIVGLIFTIVGVIGILLAFNHNVISGIHSAFISTSQILGLSLTTLPALVHTVLGLTSLNHGIRND